MKTWPEKLYWVFGTLLVVSVFLPHLDSIFMGLADRVFHLNLAQDAIQQWRAGQWPWVGQTQYAFNGISQSHNPMNPLWYGLLDFLTFRTADVVFLQGLHMCLCALLSFVFLSLIVRRTLPGLSLLWRAALVGTFVFSPAILSLFFFNDATPAFSSTPWVAVGVFSALEFFSKEHLDLRGALKTSALFLLAIASHPPIGLWTSFCLGVFCLVFFLARPTFQVLGRQLLLGFCCGASLIGYVITATSLGGSFSETRGLRAFFPPKEKVLALIDHAGGMAKEMFVPTFGMDPVPNFNQTGLFALLLVPFFGLLSLRARRGRRILWCALVPVVFSVLTIYSPALVEWPLRAIPSAFFYFIEFPYLRMNAPLLAFLFAGTVLFLALNPDLVRFLNLTRVKIIAVLGLSWMGFQAGHILFFNQSVKSETGTIVRQFNRWEHTSQFNWGNSGVKLPEGPSEAHWYLRFLGDSGRSLENLDFVREQCSSKNQNIEGLDARVCRPPFCTRDKIPEEWHARWDWNFNKTSDFYFSLETSPSRCMILGIEEPHRWKHYFEMKRDRLEMPLMDTRRVVFFLEPKKEPRCSGVEVTKSCIVEYDRARFPMKILSFVPTKVSVDVPEAGELELHKMYLHGYRVKVNGEPGEASRGENGALRVRVPSGKSFVEIDYRGPVKAKLSWAFSILFLVCGFLGTHRKKGLSLWG